jgi:fatty-acyl-CoA synthase
VSADLAALARAILVLAPSIAHVVVIDGEADVLAPGPDGVAVIAMTEALAADPEGVEWGAFDETAPCGLCFTSGTTGAPKGVTYTHRGNYLHSLRQLQADVTGLTSRDAVLTVVPMFHANAWGLPFSVPAVGGKLVLPGRQADGVSLADLIDAEQVTIGVGVPTVWLGLMDHLDETGRALPSLKRIMVGGAPMPPALMQRIEARGIAVQTTWGMTELSPLGTASLPGAADRQASQSGRPAIGIDLMLADSAGEPLDDQRGGEGRLHVRGPTVVDRYFGHDSPATSDGWFDTGDLARIDADGNLTITGRAKDLIKSGGEWINPSEIEALIGALPEVSLVAVIGRLDPKWGERPILLVELRDGQEMDDEALLAPLRGRVAPWWVPEEVIRLGNMPLASTGKIDKMRLRAEYRQA